MPFEKLHSIIVIARRMASHSHSLRHRLMAFHLTHPLIYMLSQPERYLSVMAWLDEREYFYPPRLWYDWIYKDSNKEGDVDTIKGVELFLTRAVDALIWHDKVSLISLERMGVGDVSFEQRRGNSCLHCFQCLMVIKHDSPAPPEMCTNCRRRVVYLSTPPRGMFITVSPSLSPHVKIDTREYHASMSLVSRVHDSVYALQAWSITDNKGVR